MVTAQIDHTVALFQTGQQAGGQQGRLAYTRLAIEEQERVMVGGQNSRIQLADGASAAKEEIGIFLPIPVRIVVRAGRQITLGHGGHWRRTICVFQQV